MTAVGSDSDLSIIQLIHALEWKITHQLESEWLANYAAYLMDYAQIFHNSAI